MNTTTRGIEWAAGLFEGEGCAFMAKQRSGRQYPRAAINMTDLDVLTEFQRIAGVGHIHGPYQRTTGKPLYAYVVSKNQDALDLLSRLRPYMLGRRADQIDHVNAAYAATQKGV